MKVRHHRETVDLYYVGRRWVQMTGTYEAETPTNDEFTRGAIPKSLRLAIGV